MFGWTHLFYLECLLSGMQTLTKDNRSLLMLIMVVSIVKFVLFPFAQTVDADAVTRSFLSKEWIDDPHWIMTGVWLPIHYYLNGIFLWLYNDTAVIPGLLNIILSIVMLWPFYRLVSREFSKEGALMITAIFAFSPILFRNQFMGLSETSYLFFLVLGMDLLSYGLKKEKLTSIALSGFMLTLASGVRYEAWIIILITGIFLLIGNFKKALIFGITASIFPTIWLLTNYMETNDLLHSIRGNHRWTLEIMDNNAHVDLETYLRRIWFFPFSLLIAIGPIASIDAIRNWTSRIIRPRKNDLRFLFAALFILILVFFIYNSIQGTLLLQHRFIGTLVFFLLPFASYCMTSQKVVRIAFHVALVVGLSFIYNMDSIQPLPRLKDQQLAKIVEKIPAETEYLILDFSGWDYTYYWALNSGIDHKKIIIVEGAVNSPDRQDEINQLLDQHKNVSCILVEGSDSYNALNNRNSLETIYQEGAVIVQKK